MKADFSTYNFNYAYHECACDLELGTDPNDFVTNHFLEITTSREDNSEPQFVGKARLSLIQFSLAMDAGFPLQDVMDATASILDMSANLFNLDSNGDFYDKIDEYFDYDAPMNFDVCFVERIEVLPKFRGKGIGKAVMISMARKFYNACGLIVLKAYPLQHEVRDSFDFDSDWHNRMEYSSLEKDFEKSQYQLFNWYQKMGLNNPFDIEYFIARPDDLAHQIMFDK